MVQSTAIPEFVVQKFNSCLDISTWLKNRKQGIFSHSLELMSDYVYKINKNFILVHTDRCEAEIN